MVNVVIEYILLLFAAAPRCFCLCAYELVGFLSVIGLLTATYLLFMLYVCVFAAAPPCTCRTPPCPRARCTPRGSCGNDDAHNSDNFDKSSNKRFTRIIIVRSII